MEDLSFVPSFPEEGNNHSNEFRIRFVCWQRGSVKVCGKTDFIKNSQYNTMYYTMYNTMQVKASSGSFFHADLGKCFQNRILSNQVISPQTLFATNIGRNDPGVCNVFIYIITIPEERWCSGGNLRL